MVNMNTDEDDALRHDFFTTFKPVRPPTKHVWYRFQRAYLLHIAHAAILSKGSPRFFAATSLLHARHWLKDRRRPVTPMGQKSFVAGCQASTP